jgi:hypothetical protein
MAGFALFKPETMVTFYGLDESLGEAGKYYARQGGGLMLVIAMVCKEKRWNEFLLTA